MTDTLSTKQRVEDDATPPCVDRWYVPTTSVCPPRLVLAVGNERVLYSNGGISHRECLVKTFRRWKTRTQAEARP